MAKHEKIANAGCTSENTVRKEIEQNEWSEAKVENKIEIKTGKTTGCSNTHQLHSWTRKQKSNSRLETNPRLWQEPCPYKITLFSLKKL